MTEQEQINVEVQRKLALQDAKLNQFIDEMKDFKQEMRDRDNQRHAEIAEIRNTAESIGKHVNNMTIAVAVGVGAMVITVILSILLK